MKDDWRVQRRWHKEVTVEAPERALNYVVPKATLQLVFALQPVLAPIGSAWCCIYWRCWGGRTEIKKNSWSCITGLWGAVGTAGPVAWMVFEYRQVAHSLHSCMTLFQEKKTGCEYGILNSTTSIEFSADMCKGWKMTLLKCAKTAEISWLKFKQALWILNVSKL